MKVNFLLPNYGERPVGGFKIAYLYANYLAKVGHEVTIVYAHSTSDDSLEKYIIDYIGVLVHRPDWFQFRKGIRRIYCYRFTPRVIPDADVTMATSWRTAVFLNTLSEKKGKKFYLIQDYEVWGVPKKEVEETWRYPMVKIVVSKWLKTVGENIGSNQLYYIPNSINFKKYRLIRKLSDRQPIVSMLYSRALRKRSNDGIAALKQVRKVIPNLQVRLFGVEPRTPGIPNWMQYYENADQAVIVDEVYNQASVFLCTSYWEGFGLPPMEAMACGCALVSTKCGGVEEFAIDGETALLCDVGDVDAMAEKIVYLLKDQSERRRIALNGCRKVHTYHWKDSFVKLEELIGQNV